ncbi:G patch domain-containing protein 2 [Chlorella vulgaris]
MKFKRQQGHGEFGKALQQPAAQSQSQRGGSGSERGRAVASFYGSLVGVNSSGGGWVKGGTLQDAEDISFRGSLPAPEPASSAPAAAPAAAASAGGQLHAGLGSAAAHAELATEQRQLQYDQPAGPLPRGMQQAEAAAREQQQQQQQQQLQKQSPPQAPKQQHAPQQVEVKQAVSQQQPHQQPKQQAWQPQQQRREPQADVSYGIARSNVGYRLLKKAGWTEGAGLGAQEQGVAEPVAAFQQQGNLGLGFAPKPKPGKQAGPATAAAGTAAPGGGKTSSQQQVKPKRPLPDDPLDKEDADTKVKRVKQVLQAEADDKAGKAIARYLHMAFNDTTGEPTRDSNPLLRRSHKLSATNPLL